MASFSDVALELPADAPRSYDNFEAKYLKQYLEQYVDSHVYNGISLRNRIWVNANVHSAERTATGWTLHINGAVTQLIQCNRLAVASGTASKPIMPIFPLSDGFLAPILHHRDFGIRSKAILAESSMCRNVTVLGGGKSAADMVYASLKAGRTVNWVIRTSGEGPAIFMNPAPTGRYMHAVEANATRNAAVLNPSSFHPLDDWAQMLHQTVSKREELKLKLFAADRCYGAWPDYRGREGALPCFRELEPRASFFWDSGPVGLIQHDDFWNLVSQKVHAYRGDPVGTTVNAIILDDGREVPTDVLFCGTGWDDNYSFFSSEVTMRLGLPHKPENAQSKEEQIWSDLMMAADRVISRQYPILTEPPPNCKSTNDTTTTPARLYQGIASLTDPSIVFLGRCRISNYFRCAEAQAIWATAYWDEHIAIPPYEQAQRTVAFMNAFSRRRYPSHGTDGVNFHNDLVWYTDGLIYEAGLSSHRKDWWDDPDAPCLASDLRDCKDEYIAKFGLK